MPVVAVPAQPSEGLPSTGLDEGVAELHVAAQADLLPLQPSKLPVYKLFVEHVCSVGCDC